MFQKCRWLLCRKWTVLFQNYGYFTVYPSLSTWTTTCQWITQTKCSVSTSDSNQIACSAEVTIVHMHRLNCEPEHEVLQYMREWKEQTCEELYSVNSTQKFSFHRIKDNKKSREKCCHKHKEFMINGGTFDVCCFRSTHSTSNQMFTIEVAKTYCSSI